MAVERREVLAQRAQIQKLVYASKQMISGYVCFEIKGVEEPILVACLLIHHPDVPRRCSCHWDIDQARRFRGVFQHNRPISDTSGDDPILLKNSFSTDDGKILGVIRREARSRLGGYMKGLIVAM
jgi:hypothetical protein